MKKLSITLILVSSLYADQFSLIDEVKMLDRQLLASITPQQKVEAQAQELNWCPAQTDSTQDQSLQELVNNVVSKFYTLCQRFGDQGPAQMASFLQNLNGAMGPDRYVFMGASDGLLYVVPGLVTAGQPVPMRETSVWPIWHTLFATLKKNNYLPTWVYYPLAGDLKHSYIASALFGDVRYLFGSGYQCH